MDRIRYQKKLPIVISVQMAKVTTLIFIRIVLLILSIYRMPIIKNTTCARRKGRVKSSLKTPINTKSNLNTYVNQSKIKYNTIVKFTIVRFL